MENPVAREGFLRKKIVLKTKTSLILSLISILAFCVSVPIRARNVRLMALRAAYLEQSRSVGQEALLAPPADAWFSSPVVLTLAGILRAASVFLAAAAMIVAAVALKNCTRRFSDLIFAIFALACSMYILFTVSVTCI